MRVGRKDRTEVISCRKSVGPVAETNRTAIARRKCTAPRLAAVASGS